MSHPKVEIWSGPPAICNSSFLRSLYFGYIMRGTVRVRHTWMRWLEWRLLFQAVEGFKRLLENVYFGGSDNKRFFRIVDDWMDADICWRHSLIPQIPVCSIQVWRTFHPLICGKTGTVSWCLKNCQWTEHSCSDVCHNLYVKCCRRSCNSVGLWSLVIYSVANCVKPKDRMGWAEYLDAK